MWRWAKMLNVSWKEHKTNKINTAMEELDSDRELMAKVAKLKLQ